MTEQTASAKTPRPSKAKRQKMRRMANCELRKWQEKFINYLQLTGSTLTARRYDQALRNFFDANKNVLKPRDVLRSTVEDYKIIRKRQGKSNATVNIELCAGKSLFDFIIRMSEEPTINPFDGSKALRQEERPKKALPAVIVAAIMDASKADPMDRLLALVAFTTGMRGDEMIRLEKKHFDLEHGTLVLPPEIVKGKKKGRTVPVRADLLELIRPMPEGRIFGGYAEGYNALAYRWKRLCWKAEVPPVTLHSTRHTYGTQMLRAGADLATVRDLLGHSSIKTTGGYLAGEDAEDAKKFLNLLPA